MELLVSELLSANETFEKKLSRNDVLLDVGQRDTNIYYIVSGALRVVHPTASEDFTIRFGYTGSIMANLPTFFNDQPSIFRFQALRSTSVKVIPKKVLERLLEANPTFLKSYTLLLEGLIEQQMEREIDLLTASPQERIDRIFKRSPQLFQEVPLKYIASYARMTPETLSRILSAKS